VGNLKVPILCSFSSAQERETSNDSAATNQSDTFFSYLIYEVSAEIHWNMDD